MNTIANGSILGPALHVSNARPPLRLVVVVGGSQEHRSGAPIGQWFADVARTRQGIDLDLLDLSDVTFPAGEALRDTPCTTWFADRIDAADAFVIVTPESNHGYPASLKQAIDYGCDEWYAKPVAFVAYGNAAQGLHAVEQLRLVFAALHAVTIADVVSFNLYDGSIGDDGRPRDTDRGTATAHRMLTQLLWWARALRDARADHPYVA